jgi:PAS domain S-box-containing protein
MRRSIPSILMPYSVAVLATLVCLLVRLLLWPVLGNSSPFMLFLPAVMVSVFYGGLRAGLLATALGAAAAVYFLIEPLLSFELHTVADMAGVVVFVAVGSLISGLSESLRRSRRRVEARTAALQASEERYRVTLASIGDGVIVTDTVGRVTFLNGVAEALTGWPLHEAAGRPLGEVFSVLDEASRRPAENPVERVLRTGAVVGLANHSVLRARDGGERPIDDSAAPVRNDKGVLAGVVLVFRDVTAKRRAEAEQKRTVGALKFLAEAGKVLGTSLDYHTTLDRVAKLAVPEFADWCVVYVVDRDGSVRHLAVAHTEPAQCERMRDLHRRYPLPPDFHRGFRKVLRTSEPDLIEEVDEGLLRAAARDEEHLRLMRELGLRSNLAVPLAARGRILGAMTFATAESGRCYGPEDVPLAEELARRAAVAIDNALLYQETQEADRRKDEFLAMLSHELRNPLAPIRNALHLISLPGAPAETAARAREVLGRQVQHLVRLVDDLLDVSRVMRGRIELRKEPVELASVVARAVETAQPLIDAAGHQLAVSLPAEPLRVEGDLVRLAQVVANLLNNAAKYTERGGRVTLRVGPADGMAMLSVKDTGIGIAPELLPHVFDLFVQADQSLARSQGGLGIGLTLVRSLTELHGGSVQARSEGPGRGSEFIIRLPLLSGQTAAAPPPETDGGAAARPAGRRILVVDDNVDAAESLAALLRLTGHEVWTAYDGPAALDAARTRRPDTVLLDIGLPGLSGYDVARRLRTEPGLEQALLVAVTGWGQDEDRRRAREAGFDHHLTKPVEPVALEALLAAGCSSA